MGAVTKYRVGVGWTSSRAFCWQVGSSNSVTGSSNRATFTVSDLNSLFTLIGSSKPFAFLIFGYPLCNVIFVALFNFIISGNLTPFLGLTLKDKLSSMKKAFI